MERGNITSGASAAFSAFMTSGRVLAEEGRRRAEEGREEMEVAGNSEENFAPNTEVDWGSCMRGGELGSRRVWPLLGRGTAQGARGLEEDKHEQVHGQE